MLDTVRQISRFFCGRIGNILQKERVFWMKNEELKILQKKFKKIAEKGYVEDKGIKRLG